MRKSTIWLLAVVMAFAFAGLLFLQVKYVSIILKKSSEQFNETVKRSMHQVSKNLELDETARYLEEDLSRDEANNYLYQNEQSSLGGGIITEKKYKMQFTNADGTVEHIEFHSDIRTRKFEPLSSLGSNKVPNSIVSTSKDLQQTLKRRYQYQSGLFNEVILNILHTANLKPIEERIDFKKLNNYLKSEFVNNGLNLPFVFAVINKDGKIVYQNGDIPPVSDVIQQVLFPNDPPSKQNYLKVYFPTKGDYISSSVTFIVPSIIFSLILLVTFIFTIYIVFRQKRLSEMKNDFINNMTHEFKTPIATISLASQMLKDGAVTNTPETIDRVATIIRDESKRLTFQVERVLQTALFTETRMKLKLKNINIDQLIEDLLPKFSLRVEDKGGKFSAYLEADQDEVLADEVHVTNVISNLVDNAIKYCVKPPEITIYTRNKDKEIIISVIDNGIGIAKKDQKLIFERFYRVSTGNLHDVKGFGLGLSYVKKIVEAHGGRIDVESSLEKGSCFDIILPLTVKKQKIKRTLFF